MTTINNCNNNNAVRNYFNNTLQQAQQAQQNRAPTAAEGRMCLESAIDMLEIRMSTGGIMKGIKTTAPAAPAKKKKKKKGFGAKLKKGLKKIGKGLKKIGSVVGKIAKTAISVVSGFAKMIPFVGPIAGQVLDGVGGLIPGGKQQPRLA